MRAELEAPRRDDRYKWLALSNTTLGVMLATIDSSIMLIAMPDVFRGIRLDPLAPGNSFYLLWMILSFLVVSSVGVDRDPPEGTDPVFAAYLRAKGAADADVRARTGLDWTILRPGPLTNDPGTGRVNLAESTGRGAVTRDDVAAVLVGLLDEPGTAGRTLELTGGDAPIRDAVRKAAGG